MKSFDKSQLPVKLLLALGTLLPGSLLAQSASAGAVFTATNNVDHNEIVMFGRSANGWLKPLGRFDTGGRGQGGAIDPLQSEGSIVISPDHAYLLVVNAGSSDISVFKITDTGLTLASVTPSKGGNPVSLAIHNDLVYVVNFGGNYHTAGFHLEPNGNLTFITNSRLKLSDLDPNASTAAFTPDGLKLVISERVGNKIDVFDIKPDGSIANPKFNASAGIEPFGIHFTPYGTLLVTETNGGPPKAGTTSSYAINPDNTLTTISAKADSHGEASCWVVTDGKYAWVSNTATSNIGALKISSDGSLVPSGSVALEPGPAAGQSSFPLDIALSGDAKYLHVLYSALGRIVTYKVGNDGQLTKVQSEFAVVGSSGAQGLAAY